MKSPWRLSVLFLSILTFAAVPVGIAAESTLKTYATVNGDTILADQVNAAAAAELAALDSSAPHEREKLVILHKALDAIIADKLITLEAARDQETKEHLIYAEIESNVDTPSPEEVEAFYQANKSQIAVPHDQALPLVKQYMMDQMRNRYRSMLVDRLKKQFPVKIYLDPVRMDVATAGYPSQGLDTAPVTIVEFSDFQCPYCGGLFPTLKAIEKNYGEKVRLVYRQYPLTSIHPFAQKAAEASLCAADQMKFWEFHDSMFGGQDHLTVDDLKKRAVDLKLDANAFNTCLDTGAKANAVKKDIDEGKAAGVTGTPAMFINGRFLSGNQPYAEIRDVIEDELQRQ